MGVREKDKWRKSISFSFFNSLSHRFFTFITKSCVISDSNTMPLIDSKENTHICNSWIFYGNNRVLWCHSMLLHGLFIMTNICMKMRHPLMPFKFTRSLRREPKNPIIPLLPFRRLCSLWSWKAYLVGDLSDSSHISLDWLPTGSFTGLGRFWIFFFFRPLTFASPAWPIIRRNCVQYGNFLHLGKVRYKGYYKWKPEDIWVGITCLPKPNAE